MLHVESCGRHWLAMPHISSNAYWYLSKPKSAVKITKYYELNNKVNKTHFLSFNWFDHVLHQNYDHFFLFQVDFGLILFELPYTSTSRNHDHRIELFSLYSKFYVPSHFSLSLYYRVIVFRCADDFQWFFQKIHRNNAPVENLQFPTTVNCFQ